MPDSLKPNDQAPCSIVAGIVTVRISAHAKVQGGSDALVS
jgi:hypothetical protein